MINTKVEKSKYKITAGRNVYFTDMFPQESFIGTIKVVVFCCDNKKNVWIVGDFVIEENK